MPQRTRQRALRRHEQGHTPGHRRLHSFSERRRPAPQPANAGADDGLHQGLPASDTGRHLRPHRHRRRRGTLYPQTPPGAARTPELAQLQKRYARMPSGLHGPHRAGQTNTLQPRLPIFGRLRLVYPHHETGPAPVHAAGQRPPHHSRLSAGRNDYTEPQSLAPRAVPHHDHTLRLDSHTPAARLVRSTLLHQKIIPNIITLLDHTS